MKCISHSINNIYWLNVAFSDTFLFMLHSRNNTYKIGNWHVLAFSLFHPPAAQIDCCVNGFTGLNLQSIFARFTWLFGKCEQSVDILVFCWNLKGEQFLTSYFPLSLLIIYISFNYWLMNKLTMKRMCHKCVGMLHVHSMASAEQYNQSMYNTKQSYKTCPLCTGTT